MNRWHGLADLLQDAVHHGTAAVEGVHQQVARTPLAVIGLVPPLAPVARAYAECQAHIIGMTYATIRAVNGAVGAVARICIDVAAEARVREEERCDPRSVSLDHALPARSRRPAKR